MLAGGGARLELRGAPESAETLAEVLRAGRAAGFAEIVVRTNAIDIALDSLRGAGAILVPLFSHASAAHDRVAGREGALALALVGMRAAAANGLAIEIEVPRLPARLQDPSELVRLAHRAVGPSLRAARFVLPRRPVPRALAPPRWPDSMLADAIDAARALGIATPLPPSSGIGLCALREHPHAAHAFAVAPPGRARSPGATKLEPCAACACADRCPGVAPSYASAHGAQGLAPYREPPAFIHEHKRRLRVWTDAEREAARNAGMLVLRPTVHCNQDCIFCSANETTQNVWPDPGEMMRAIARAAARGVKRVSFSGGEPTLSKHLVDYVKVARQSGIRSIELVTNGALLDERRVRALREAGLNHAFVSLHAHDEALSSAMTLKAGDFERSARAIALLVDAGVETVINHVINARNFRYVERFVELVHARFAGRPLINFAFVTPQFRALEHPELVPPLRDVMPSLRRAMRRALALGQPFRVGSRQGIPPCQLAEFEAWSDALELANEAASEDAHQKQRAPGCDACRYARSCTGLWRPYVERHGLRELAPLPGPPIDEEERLALLRHRLPGPWEVPLTFEQVHPRLRRPELEGEPLSEIEVVDDTHAPAIARSRPLRLVIAGSGARAHELARAVRQVSGLAIDAVASPHALDLSEDDRRDFAGAPAYRDAAEALDALSPDSILIASSTASHAELARAAAARGVPALVSVPLTRTIEEAAELARLEGATLVPALPERHLEIDIVLADRISFARRGTAPLTPGAWSRRALVEALHPLVSLALAGGGEASIEAASWSGDARPERVWASLAVAGRRVELAWTLSAVSETRIAAGARAWLREGPLETGAELRGMLEAFRDAVLGLRPPMASVADALSILRVTHAWVAALEASGAPFRRPGAPKHVASRGLGDT